MAEWGRLSRFLFLQAMYLIGTRGAPDLHQLGLPSGLCDFLGRCLQMDVDRRASAEELLQVQCKAAAGPTALPCQDLLLGQTPGHRMGPPGVISALGAFQMKTKERARLVEVRRDP